ncbi:unnamed protein product [Dicrocoelium dendriticum]|nr:unnamed protein product [Dicrocoelium dendriticum]
MARSNEAGGHPNTCPLPEDAATDQEDEEELDFDTWSSAVHYQATLDDQSKPSSSNGANKRRRIRPDSYFSDDEEELVDDS